MRRWWVPCVAAVFSVAFACPGSAKSTPLPTTASLSAGSLADKLELARESLVRDVAQPSPVTSRRADAGMTVGARFAPGVRVAPIKLVR